MSVSGKEASVLICTASRLLAVRSFLADVLCPLSYWPLFLPLQPVSNTCPHTCLLPYWSPHLSSHICSSHLSPIPVPYLSPMLPSTLVCHTCPPIPVSQSCPRFHSPVVLSKFLQHLLDDQPGGDPSQDELGSPHQALGSDADPNQEPRPLS